jgi:hypothetical protein
MVRLLTVELLHQFLVLALTLFSVHLAITTTIAASVVVVVVVVVVAVVAATATTIATSGTW